jgi:hypothetical protein
MAGEGFCTILPEKLEALGKVCEFSFRVSRILIFDMLISKPGILNRVLDRWVSRGDDIPH